MPLLVGILEQLDGEMGGTKYLICYKYGKKKELH